MLNTSTLNIVKDLLKRRPETRDNDMELIIAVWQKEDPKLRSVHMTFLMFAHNFRKGIYTHFESIRRTRQRLQEEYPELRGERYKKRKEVIEPEVREAVRSPEFKRPSNKK